MSCLKKYNPIVLPEIGEGSKLGFDCWSEEAVESLHDQNFDVKTEP